MWLYRPLFYSLRLKTHLKSHYTENVFGGYDYKIENSFDRERPFSMYCVCDKIVRRKSTVKPNQCSAKRRIPSYKYKFGK